MTISSETSKRAVALNQKISALLDKRLRSAHKRFQERCMNSFSSAIGEIMKPQSPWALATQAWNYWTDTLQRSVLALDALRERGNQYLEHNEAGMPPVLHFRYETLLDARDFERPVNYALLQIIPPDGVEVDPRRRPYIVIDPRAGHGPGIGGFKDDSQVGVALRAGHPVYFVSFFPEPVPGQTLLDVMAAESVFVAEVRARHPDSKKPVLIGNCQGGWAAMMLVAANPAESGPVVINGAPMAYWGGAFADDGRGDNPMRYSGGFLGGSWLASFTADLGQGRFDGAHLVQNFENLNPANTFWDKYYHVYANIDTEVPRFLEFERWWGGFYMMNREEIEWITQNLFVGNRLWKDGQGGGSPFDLRNVQSPIIMFASLGDNITPPQQAFNWVADIYGSTEEIKACGQVIVGLLHQDVGHLGIFVSGRVAQREHRKIVTVLESIESLAPGLYGMEISERINDEGETEYQVEFVEHRLEEVVARLNLKQRKDEEPFEAVNKVSEFNQKAYELFAQPLVQAVSTETSARAIEKFHPLRFQRWAISDLNPLLAWVGPVADQVRKHRRAQASDEPARKLERAGSDFLSASLDYYREVRDAASEALFFQTYGSLFGLWLDRPGQAAAAEPAGEQESVVVRNILAKIAEGGYAAAVARVAVMLKPRGTPIPLARVEVKASLADRYRELLPDLPKGEWRRVRGEQEVIFSAEPEQALVSLPQLVDDQDDRARLLDLMERLLAEPEIAAMLDTPRQQAMLVRILQILRPRRQPAGGAGAASKPAPSKTAKRPARKAAKKTAGKPISQAEAKAASSTAKTAKQPSRKKTVRKDAKELKTAASTGETVPAAGETSSAG